MAKPKRSKLKEKQSILWRLVLIAVLFGLAAYVLTTHWHTMLDSLQLARRASIRWLVLSLLLTVLTFYWAAGIYGRLALHRLHYFQTLLIEIAAMFVNRLLPSGLGGLGLHGVYLYKKGHTSAEATVVVSVNNLLGMAAHLTLLLALALFRPHVFSELWSGHGFAISWQVGLIAAFAIVAATSIPAVRLRVRKFADGLVKSLRAMPPHKLLQAFVLALMLTMTYTLVLFSSAHSLGIGLSVIQIFIVFSIGMLTSTATPTPGGLVGAEAGLFAGFVAYGVSDANAGAAVLLFRLATYWLPLLPGLVALGLARGRQLV